MTAFPNTGPWAISIPGISDVSILAGASSPRVAFRWPKAYKLGGFCCLTRSGTDQEIAKLRLSIVDDSGVQYLTDGFGNTFTANMLAMRGIIGLDGRFGGRWQSFQRPVKAGEIWNIQLTNDNAAAVVPWLAFRLEVP